MKTQAYRFNGQLTTNAWEMSSISIMVTTTMIQSVIEKSGTKLWTIKMVGEQFLSNKKRNCAVMTYHNSLNFIHDVMDKLELSWIESSATVDFYRQALDNCRTNNYTEPSYIIFNSATRRISFTNNTPFVVKGRQSRGDNSQTAHILARRIK